MKAIFSCVTSRHDGTLIALAGLVCVIGVYAAFAVSTHARRSEGRDRQFWMAVSIVAAGCTAWATHFIALLAFRAGMSAAFEPVRTLASLLCAIILIGAGIVLAVRARGDISRFAGGMVIAGGIAALHYIGQSAYVVVGVVTWDIGLVVVSLAISLVLAGCATLVAKGRHWLVGRLGAPLLLLSIAILHFSGMAAMTIVFDPRQRLPDDAVPPAVIAPVVAGVSLGLLALAFLGYKFSLDARRRMRRDRQRLRELANLALEGLLVCDGDTITTANDSCAGITGFEPSSLIGRSVASLLPDVTLENLPEIEERETDLVGANGRVVPVRVLRRTIRIGEKTQTVLALRDQRERLRTEAKIRKLAYTDSLTGLLNRLRFSELLGEQFAACHSTNRPFALLVLDLDRFKAVNDLYGHATGDALLRLVADRLSAEVSEAGVAARLGGDEFVVLQSKNASPSSAADLASRCIDRLSRPYTVDGQMLHIGASVGLALAPADGLEPEELMRNADLALYAAKVAGKTTFRMFEAELGFKMRERRYLEAGLREALVRGEFELHYQPLLDTRSNRITCAEALVRWRHPTRGMIPPLDFIGIAEESGFIVELGAWILRQACAEAAGWPDDVCVAVNLSPIQFRHPGLVEMAEDALAATSLPPRRLELEITEGVLLSDEERTLATLQELRALGIRISMDDFGTGYSSLSYLRRFPFDKIKVDQSFTRQLPGDADSAAIIRAVLSMSACLRISTVVEGGGDAGATRVHGGCGLRQRAGLLHQSPPAALSIRRLPLGARGKRHFRHASPRRGVRRAALPAGRLDR